jgi:hypothetical protein
MSDVTTLVQDYIASFNETDPARRRQLIDRVWAEDATYIDPVMAGDGRDGIDRMVAGAQAQFPGHRFEPALAPDAHHDRVRFGWRLVSEADGATVAVGTDFGVLDDGGRLRSITGFLEAPAA